MTHLGCGKMWRLMECWLYGELKLPRLRERLKGLDFGMESAGPFLENCIRLIICYPFIDSLCFIILINFQGHGLIKHSILNPLLPCLSKPEDIPRSQFNSARAFSGYVPDFYTGTSFILLPESITIKNLN